MLIYALPKTNIPSSTCKCVVGILVSFWDGLLSGAMLVSGSLYITISPSKIQLNALAPVGRQQVLVSSEASLEGLDVPSSPPSAPPGNSGHDSQQIGKQRDEFARFIETTRPALQKTHALKSKRHGKTLGTVIRPLYYSWKCWKSFISFGTKTLLDLRMCGGNLS